MQNSDGTDLMKVTDDGALQINSDATQRFTIANANGSAALNFRYNNIYTSGGNVLYISGNSTIISGGGSERLRTSPTGTTIKGSGATSATTALLVENSAGTDLFKVQDNGNATFSGNTSSQRFYTNLGFYHSGATNNVLLPNITTGWVLQTANATGNVQVKNINVTASKETSASLQVDSTTQGFLPPRMTDAERDAITNPAAGLMIYDTSNNQMNYWNGSTWIAF